MSGNIKIRIYKPHTHAGVSYLPGTDGVDLEVSKADAEFIRNLGLDRKPGVSAEAKAKPDASASNA